jgi:general secretion pathway protein G
MERIEEMNQSHIGAETPRRAPSREGARGVTLVEVLIVVAILSLIAGGVAIFAIPRFQQAQKDTAKTDTKTLIQVVETWKLNHPGTGGACPTIEDLKNDKALKADQNTNDPWGKPYKIVCTGEDYGVMSPGPDGKEGSEDDIWSGTKPAK